MILKGKVKKGLGNASFWIKKVEELFYTRTGIKLYLGTLNVKLNAEYKLQNYWVIEGKEYGGTQRVYVQECRLFNSKAYIVRSEKTAHKSDIIEIVSDINFREKFNLKDEDIINIEL